MKLAVASSALSKHIVPSDDYCQALRHVHESTEKFNCLPILFVSEPSKLDPQLTVQIQLPQNPELPEEDWTSANTVKQSFPLLPVDGTSEDFCKTRDRANQVVTQQGQGKSITHQVRMFKLMPTPECCDRFEQIHAEQSVANEALPVGE